MPLFTMLLAATSWIWLGPIWYMGVLASLVLLLIGLAVMSCTNVMKS